MAAINRKVASIISKVAAINYKVAAIIGKVAAINSKVAAIIGKVAAINSIPPHNIEIVLSVIRLLSLNERNQPLKKQLFIA